MPEATFTVHNPTDQPLAFTVHHGHPSAPTPHVVRHVVPARGSLELPLLFFRSVFLVRCTVAACRELGFCTKAHRGDVLGGQAPQLFYGEVPS